MKNLLKNKKFLIFLFCVLIILIFLTKLNYKNNFNNKLNSGFIYNNLQKDNENKYQNLNCSNLPILEDNSQKLVTKVIDGDTFLIEGGYSIRILGIDADEKGYSCYEEAKNKLEELILNKKVKLVKDLEDVDQYCRYLRYVFVDNKNVSKELVKQGLVVSRFYTSNTKYRNEIIQAEKIARENLIGCKWSKDFNNDNNALESNTKSFNWVNLTKEKTGLNVINSCDAKNYYDKEIIIEGKIIDTYRSKTNTIFLNFGAPYPKNCFVAVIFNSNLKNFIDYPEKYYKNKIVRIRGLVKEYQGKPEIILKNQSQIEIADF